MRNILLLFILFLTSNLFSQIRDSIYIKTDIFELVYSEKLQQPKWVKYTVLCPDGSASRKGLDFYTCDSIITSNNLDYYKNPYDKGHLAPAASFNCDSDMLYKTFTYLNCSLQQENLNRTTWKYLEERERELSTIHNVVVEIVCVFSDCSKVLPAGATVPDGYLKTITYGNNVEVYYFKNEKPLYTDYTKYLIK